MSDTIAVPQPLQGCCEVETLGGEELAIDDAEPEEPEPQPASVRAPRAHKAHEAHKTQEARGGRTRARLRLAETMLMVGCPFRLRSRADATGRRASSF
ncbi:MAG: hypothetical protein WBW93_05365 [Steroidobacteraceae bacterium]